MIINDNIKKKLFEQKRYLINKNPQIENNFIRIFDLDILPIRCFRDNIPIYSSNNEIIKKYKSSGSTDNIQASHCFSQKGLHNYEINTCQGFEFFLNRFNLSKKIQIISFVPSIDIWCHSSLADMINFFKLNGFNINYFDIERDINSFMDKIVTFEKEILIFGTSFHHLLMYQYVKKRNIKHILQNHRITVIDTGGTKGRTEAFCYEQIREFLYDTYGNISIFASEYGMCELSSQAWSYNNPHDKVFACNPNLSVLAINPLNNTILPHNEIGFLCFIDENNIDSYMAILTEDIGKTYDSIYENNYKLNLFELVSRAPDASLKGCSLNVKNNFLRIELTNSELNNSLIKIKNINLINANIFNEIFDLFDKSLWSESELFDLKILLNDFDKLNINRKYFSDKKYLQIISSVNIPITWVYPTIIAYLLGYTKVNIKLPSLRNDDIFSVRVYNQILNLASILVNCFSDNFLEISQNFNLIMNVDTLIVFGSNTTCETIKNLLPYNDINLLLYGDIVNSLDVNNMMTIDELVKKCTTWNGRGCLTPVILFMNNDIDEEYIVNFIKKYDIEFNNRFSCYPDYNKFIHVADILEINAKLKNINMFNKIKQCDFVYVIDLRTVSESSILQSDFDFSKAGVGLIYLLNSRDSYLYLSKFSAYDILPNIFSKHENKYWSDIL